MPINFQQAEPLDADPGMDLAPPHADPSLFARAILFGIGGAIASALIQATFIGVTHINIGYLAILVAYLVAKAMTLGSRGQGGRKYQIAALILTYLAVCASHSLLAWWYIRQQEGPVPMSGLLLFGLAKYGLLSPFTRFQTEGMGAAFGLLILFIGLRAAWRMTSGIPGAVQHPFAR